MTLLENIAEYLENQGIGTRATDIFIGHLTDMEPSEDEVVMIDQTGGIEPDKYLKIARPTVQIMVRSKSHQAGLAKMQAIFDLFHQMQDDSVLVAGGEDVMDVMAMNEPQHLARDEEGRDIFTCTFIFRIRRTV